MTGGIRATVEFTAAGVCPIADLSRRLETTIDSVTANACPDGDGTVAEFSVEGDLDADAVDDGTLTPVFSHGSTRRYRLVNDGEAGCPCERLGRFGCPAARYVAREGTLTLVFHAADYDELRAVVAALRERFPDVDIRRFVQAPSAGEADSEYRVLVDRGRLTARQLEVLETAHEMGYFARPREANATEVAAALDIAPSTFREHLVAAESKLLDDIL